MKRRALGSAILLLAAIPVTTCGGGSTGEEPCRTLRRGPPAVRAADRMVELEVRFLTVENGFLLGLGLDLPDEYRVQAIPSRLSGADRCGTGDLGVARDLIGGPEGAIYALAEGYRAGWLLPLLLSRGWPAVWNEIFAFVDLPGSGRVDVDPVDRETIANNPYTLQSPIVATGPGETGYGILGRLPSDLELQTILDAIRDDPISRAVVVAPKVIVFDGQTSLIQVGEEVPIVGLLPEFQEAVRTIEATPTTVVTGLTTVLRPTLAEDENVVRIEIFPESQSVSILGSTIIDVNEEPAEVQIPIVGVPPVVTTVRVPDGGTILLGGMIRGGSEAQEGVPTLRKIPYVGPLFRSVNREAALENLMILVTARVLDFDE